MFNKILPASIVNYVTKWLLFVIFIQILFLFIFNFLNLTMETLLAFSRVISLLGYLFFMLLPFFCVKKVLIINKSSGYRGWLIGFGVSLIFAMILLVFSFLDLGIKALLQKNITHSNLIIFGSVIGSMIEVVIGTFSGGIAQMILKKNNTLG